MDNYCLMSRDSVWDDYNILEMDGTDDYITMSVYLMPLSWKQHGQNDKIKSLFGKVNMRVP